MKQGMTNVDVAALAAELAPLLVGARMDKVYQPAKDTILLRVRRKGTGKADLLFQLGRFLTVTRRPPENPDKPSMLAQVLRTTLENSRIVGVRQVGFDRLLRIDVERGDGRRALVFELFGDGNLLLLGPDDVIELPMRGMDFGARRIRKGEPYMPPPGGADPFAWDQDELRRRLQAAKRDVVRCLALDAGFGPLWAEELCLRAGVPKNTPAAQATDAHVADLHAAMQALHRDIQRNDLAPALVYEGKAAAPNDAEGGPEAATAGTPAAGAAPDAPPAPPAPSANGAGAGSPSTAGQAPELVDAVPFVMRRYPAPRFSQEEARTFREALDVLFVGGPETDEEGEPDDPRRARFAEAKAKVQRQLDQVDAAVQDFVRQEAEAQAEGDAIYACFPQVQSVLDALRKARGTHGWAEVERILAQGRAEGNPFALQVPELRPHEGTAVLELRDLEGRPRRVEVDLRLSVQENAERAYAAGKKARSRREGAQQARADAEARLRDVEAKGLDAYGAPPARPEKSSRHFWFEAYRWTLTPSGFVAVGGRSAPQNDAVVKKYLRDGDRYVHAEIHGAPSVVVRPVEGPSADIPTTDLRAACHFAVVSSRAWRQFGPATAYWVNASQVSKTPRSGEYVPRGSWIIHGKRNVEPDLPMEWWVGKVRFRMDGTPVPAAEPDPEARTVAKLAGATLETLRRYGSGIVHIVPGTMDPNDAAIALAERYDVTVEEAQAVLPAGPVELRELPT